MRRLCLLLCPAVLAAQQPKKLIATRELLVDGNTELFARSGSVLPLKNGDFVLAVEQGVMVFYNAQGKRTGTFGRFGEGPGEFKVIPAPSAIGDSLLVIDFTLRRLTIVAPDRKTVRSERIPNGIQIAAGAPETFRSLPPLPLAMYPNGDFIFRAVHSVKGATAPWFPEDDRLDAVIRTDHQGVFKSRIMVAPSSSPGDCSVTFPTEKGATSWAAPFCSARFTVVLRDGSRFATLMQDNRQKLQATSTYAVTMVGAKGDTIYSQKISYAPIPIPARVIDSIIDSRPQEARNALRALPQAKSRDPVRSIHFGADGSLWISEYVLGSTETRFRVLNPNGSTRGVLALPKSTYFGWADASTLWVWQEDEDGVPSLVKYGVK